MATQLSKKRKFIDDGVFFAEMNEVLTRELAEDGYSGVEFRVIPMRTKIIIRATRTQNVLGEKGRRIKEAWYCVQKANSGYFGKVRAAHAKSIKLKDGYMISSGQPVKEYIDSAIRHVLLRQEIMDGALAITGSLHHIDKDLLGWCLCERQVKSGSETTNPSRRSHVYPVDAKKIAH